MTSHLTGIALVAIVGLGACSAPDQTRSAEGRSEAIRSAAKRITILHVADTHSHLEAEGPKDPHLDGTLGGIVKAASIVYPMKASDPSTLFVHAGDLFQEDVYFNLTAGTAELGLLSRLGLDAMTLGNHEFNLTPAVLLQALATAFPAGGTPVVTANLDFRNSSLAGLEEYVRPNAIREVEGVRVGFFGLVTPAPDEQFPAPDTDPPAVDPNVIGIASQQVQALRAPPGSADVVVLLSHLGFDQDEAIARAVPGVDAIVGGHDHVLKEAIVTGPGGKQVPIVHAGDFYKWVGKLTLLVEDGKVTVGAQEFIPVDRRVERFAPFAEVVSGLQAQAQATFGEELFHAPIAYALIDVVKDVDPASPQRDTGVGNLITDALRHAGKTDLGLTASGFLTEGLTSGFLVREDAFRIVGDGFDPADPFGARLGSPLFRLDLPGAVLLQAVATAAAIGGDYFPQVSGMRLVLDATDPGALQARVHGAPVNPERMYSATVNFALWQGLQQLLGGPIAATPLGVTEYEAVRDWMIDLRVLLYTPQGRILVP